VRDYALAHEFGSDRAGHKLAPALSESWFWQAFAGRLRLQRSLEESEVITMLAMSAGATASHRPQLQQILAFLEVSGLIERDGSTVRVGPVTQIGSPDTPAEELPASPEDRATTDVPAASEQTAASARPGQTGLTASPLSTGFTQHPEGILRFHVSVNVEMSELADWKPDRIAALFGGIAQVLAAKANVERDAADSI
jgi:hypothetical protein